ncbi:MAG: hypothetical protein A3B74_02155 [Candidatus Kerfeldbacteria bacterium RIFCSPHIGHO2_02_FULL_42_14]|uniref:Transcription regulator TrmB N-terminal domain-containing protein n=1 Tax=Candidatus Kerfeldbacteria bacterium RIFCSPHIGHO2_02_FULL_42_14 TaxID=1798540 RepID=A0A1G2APQ2_9BACT|nr:MAG: hypothetical protein A3B74_02155 [Candidatus Kerfeldbacteria bacterium RIFCSPHIGHO2_02_FULL_42_14]OGY81819.1 MAG: hypothetical protein A3E60_00730 [Candidatus Kerfeldbacteria bacterium RIFCSPHIGHO2_12_FULL_42_13]OGY84508.1 MAG: hypothetical protein A3I91_00345 [Candidatus Kerfeldbacteria bacterium RIFCSPLOWO2_02_FULL_42_19]OGY87615.1 MAG: hypothetical protein A3G01_02695 [Candidatus Kerfeldbacteria bacterium RIFCSPLOWO2_12_FULL_43_9]
MKQENQKFLVALLHLGLSDKEATVYIALLTLGKATVSVVAREAGINRTTGYDILDSLVNLGLVTISGKEPKQEYIAGSPANIRKLLSSRIRRDNELFEYAEAIIPQLTSLHNISDRPKIRFYEGTDGLKHVYEDTLTSHETIRAYAAVDDMYKALPDYFPKYYQRRTKRGIKIRAVIPATDAGKERAAQDKTENRDTALVSPDKFYFSPEINIYDNKVMIASWREKLGIIIESNEIAEAMKKIFELSWQEAKRLDNEER